MGSDNRSSSSAPVIDPSSPDALIDSVVALRKNGHSLSDIEQALLEAPPTLWTLSVLNDLPRLFSPTLPGAKSFHLPGKHPQKDHGGGKNSDSTFAGGTFKVSEGSSSITVDWRVGVWGPHASVAAHLYPEQKRASMFHISVDEKARRNGVGTALLRKMYAKIPQGWKLTTNLYGLTDDGEALMKALATRGYAKIEDGHRYQIDFRPLISSSESRSFHLLGLHPQKWHAGKDKDGSPTPSAPSGAQPSTTGGVPDIKRGKDLTFEDTDAWKALSANHGQLPMIGGYGESQMLRHIAKQQGFDGLPHVVSEKELQGYIAAGEKEIFRGVTSPDFAKSFREGEYFAGQGLRGSGTYVAVARGHLGTGMKSGDARATDYAGDGGSVLHMTLRSGARVGEFKTLFEDARSLRAETLTALRKDPTDKKAQMRHSNSLDVGEYAAMKGYDAVDNGDTMIILNRTAVRVAREDFR